MPNPNIVIDESPFDTELKKAAAESGWTAESERLLLLRFVAAQARFRPSTLSEFKNFLKDAAKEESIAPVFPRLAAEDDEEDDEEEDLDEDDDLDDEDDEDLDDEWDDDEDEDEDEDDEDDEDDGP